MTWPEKILWSRLRHSQLGYSFQRQAIVRGFVVDFWCPTARIAIELDGAVHDAPDKIEDDKRRDEFLAKSGVKCLRFQNWEVRKGMSAIMIRIWDECYSRAPISVRPLALSRQKVISRHENTVEMRGLTAFKEGKRLQEHEKQFSHRYWKDRRFSVKNAKTPWIKGGNL